MQQKCSTIVNALKFLAFFRRKWADRRNESLIRKATMKVPFRWIVFSPTRLASLQWVFQNYGFRVDRKLRDQVDYDWKADKLDYASCSKDLIFFHQTRP